MKPINSATRWYFKPAAFILLLLALCTSVAVLIQSAPPPKPASFVPGRTPLHQGSMESRVSWYFQSGQWRSDVHTFVNLLTYLVRSDPAPLTNQPPPHVRAQAGLVSPAPIQS